MKFHCQPRLRLSDNEFLGITIYSTTLSAKCYLYNGNWCTKTMHTSIYRINESNTSIGLYEYNIFLLHKMNNVITVPQRIMLLVAHGRKWKWHVFLNEEIWIHFEISWAFCTEKKHLKNQEGEISSNYFSIKT